MPIPRPTEKEILTRIHNRILNETNLTANLDSSAIGVILKIFAAESNIVWAYIEDLHEQSNLSTAGGTNLDNFGLLFGVPRRQSSKSTTTGQTRSVRFTNSTGSNISVPAGTRVFKYSEPQIAYFTVEAATAPAGGAVDVHVTAAREGEIYNVGVGELNRHDIASAGLIVANTLPINNGNLQESDAAYRQRILQELSRRNVLNVHNVDALLRSIPGIRDVYVMEFERGAGTFDAVIIPYNFSDTSLLVSEAQALLNASVPAGLSALARGPRYRQLDIRVNIRFATEGLERREQVRQQIRNLIISRVDNLPVENGTGNGTFLVNQIRDSAILADSLVLDASVVLGLDGMPLAPQGEIRLGKGERLTIRSLSIE